MRSELSSVMEEESSAFEKLCTIKIERLRQDLLRAHKTALQQALTDGLVSSIRSLDADEALDLVMELDASAKQSDQPPAETQKNQRTPHLIREDVDQDVPDSEEIPRGVTTFTGQFSPTADSEESGPDGILVTKVPTAQSYSSHSHSHSRSRSPSPPRRHSDRDVTLGTASMWSMNVLYDESESNTTGGRNASAKSPTRDGRRPSVVSNGTSGLSAFSKSSGKGSHKSGGFGTSSEKSPNSGSSRASSFRRIFPELRQHPCLSALWRFMTDPDSSQAAWIYKQIHNPFFVASVLISFSQHLAEPLFDDTTFDHVQIAIDFVFLTELIIGLICCPDRGVFIRDVYNYIDLFAVSPLLPRLLIVTGAVVLPDETMQLYRDILSIVPTLRLLKLLRRFHQFHLVYAAFKSSMEALPVMIYTLFVQALVFSSLLYVVEPRTNLETLPEAFWLVIVTMMTVGYGDKTPESTAGFVIVTILIISSALYMAIPLGIIGNVFNRIWQDRSKLLLIRRTKQRMVEWGYRPDDVPMLFGLFTKTTGLGRVEGSLTFREFNRMFNEMRVGTNPQQILELYQYLDDDRTGYVTSEAFLAAVFPNWHVRTLISRSSTSDSMPGFRVGARAQ